MLRRRPTRLRALLALAPALLVSFAGSAVVAGPAHAGDAPTRHQNDLIFDKRENFAEVPAGGAVTKLTANCGADYYVLSGSIRVDVVNGADLSAIDVRRSAAGSNAGDLGPTRWDYEIINNAPAGQRAAQIKLMISCVKKVTAGGDSDQHAIQFERENFFTFPLSANRLTNHVQPLACSQDESPFSSIPTGVGTTIDASNQARRLIGMNPRVGLVAGIYYPANVWDYTIGSDATTPGVALTPSLWCMKRLTGSSSERTNVHQHYINTSLQATRFTVPRAASNAPFSQSVYCPSGQYGVTPTYSIQYSSVKNGLRLIGIGYQGDQMVFKFVNPNGDASPVEGGVLCIGNKTSFDTNPTPGAGPGGQKLLTAVRSKTVHLAARGTASTTMVCASKTDYVAAGGFSGSGAVTLTRSGGGSDPSKWPFTLRNTSGKPVNVALHVKCLAPWAEGHTLLIEGESTATPNGVDHCSDPKAIAIRPSIVGKDELVECLSRASTIRINHYHTLITAKRSAVVKSGGTTTLKCPAKFAALVPSVNLADGQRLTQSKPGDGTWTFSTAGAKGATTVSLTCLRKTTTPEDLQPISNGIVPATT